MRLRSAIVLLCLLATLLPTTPAQAAVSHRIISRKEWGADELLRVQAPPGSSSSSSSQTSSAPETDTRTSEPVPSGRDADCKDARVKYPAEFTASVPVTRNEQGELLRWPMEYSPSVKLLVVHHTAIAVNGDARTGLERMRALYQFHATNRGWGDIGYHYVIDDQGQIYEGRAGGDYVVGGHVYCNNVGTVGVALMGNFDKEQPTQEQTKSLQWLLQLLAQKYQINTSQDVVFHGKSLPTIVGHRQLVSTDCPGTTMWSALDQVRNHVRTGDIDVAVTFPEIAPQPIVVREIPVKGIVTGKDGLASLGETVIEGRPGAEVALSVFFRATKKAYAKNTRIGRITRTAGLNVFLEQDGQLLPARDLRTPLLVKKGSSVVIPLRVRLPMDRGSAALKIGSINYRFEMAGRAARGRQLINANVGYSTLQENTAPIQQTQVGAVRERPLPSSSSTARISLREPSSSKIRIRLTPELPMSGLVCGDPSVRFTSSNDLTHVEGYFREPKNYRGTIECRVIDGELVLINEVLLEEYLAGVREEADSEPYEKQLVFAIAARSYALYHTDPAHRKFPGMPYDGTDSPHSFQTYDGVGFELRNPRWVRAVQETASKVLTYNGEVIKTPYFSTDPGKTRSPVEAGWNDYPFAEIFTPKDDPWCEGMPLRGHGVGMSACGVSGQIREGKTTEQILQYYYPGTVIERR